MAQYSKAIVAIVMMVALFLKAGFGVDWDLDQATLQTWIDTGIAIFTPLAVYLFPNKASGGATLRSPAVATGIAFTASLAVILFLSGCASFSVGRDATLQQRAEAARTDLNTVDIFMTVYATFPRCGVGVQQPCSSPVVLDLWSKGRVAAEAALDAADALIAAGSPTERILVALQEAQKAVLLLQNLQRNSSG